MNEPIPTPRTDEEELRTAQDSLMSDEANIKIAYDFARTLESELATALREWDELDGWKEAAISVMPPMQEIGKALGLTLGQSIHDKILPGIQRLTTERDASLAQLEKVKAQRDEAQKEAFIAGYQSGHERTVEGCYSLDVELVASEYLDELRAAAQPKEQPPISPTP